MSYSLLIIEDDPIIAQDISEKLQSLNYNVIGYTDSKEEAVQLTLDREPDVLLSDIVLEGKSYDGIDIVKRIYKDYKLPIIYLTGNSESTTIKKATASLPAAFLTKPVRFKELSTNIDIAIERFKQKYDFVKANEEDQLIKKSVFIPDRNTYHRVPKKDLLYAEADTAYTNVVTAYGKVYNLSLNLKQFSNQIEDQSFMRVSRKHFVNLEHVDKIKGQTLILTDNSCIHVPHSRRSEVLERFNIMRSS